MHRVQKQHQQLVKEHRKSQMLVRHSHQPLTLTLSLSHSLTLSLSLTPSHTPSLTHSFTHTLLHTLLHSLTPSLTHTVLHPLQPPFPTDAVIPRLAAVIRLIPEFLFTEHVAACFGQARRAQKVSALHKRVYEARQPSPHPQEREQQPNSPTFHVVLPRQRVQP